MILAHCCLEGSLGGLAAGGFQERAELGVVALHVHLRDRDIAHRCRDIRVAELLTQDRDVATIQEIAGRMTVSQKCNPVARIPTLAQSSLSLR